MLDHMESLASAMKDSNMKIEFEKDVKKSLEEVVCFLEITDTQAILFSTVFMLSFNQSCIDISDIAEHMKSSNLKVASFLPDLEVLVSRKLIQYYNRSINPHRKIKDTIHDISFNISRRVLDAIMNEDPGLIKSNLEMDMVSLLEYIYQLIEDRDDEQITYEELIQETEELMIANHELSFVKRINKLDLMDSDRIVLLYVCREIINMEDDVDLSRCLNKIFSDPRWRYHKRRSLVLGKNQLVKKEILELNDGVFRSDKDIKLTDHGIEMLFEEDIKLLEQKEKQDKNLLKHEDIKPVKLFFKKELQVQLNNILKVLEEDNYKTTLERLVQKNMPQGITILLHGAPGTGKTAMAYQIARMTGRDIIQVDISNTKSFWYGESEKKIRKIFTDYFQTVDKKGLTPILFFNECDAVFGKRKEVGNSTVDQTENAIQNIILQALEEMKGILIATTNLTVNLDKAFERRFLWKLRFDKPTQEARSKIWRTKLPYLKEREARTLASTFTLSGGNIENIARKVVMHEILHGAQPTITEIHELCREESMMGEKQRIGY